MTPPGDIIATTTSVVCREERLWIVSALTEYIVSVLLNYFAIGPIVGPTV
jgi:hypothetical protein